MIDKLSLFIFLLMMAPMAHSEDAAIDIQEKSSRPSVQTKAESSIPAGMGGIMEIMASPETLAFKPVPGDWVRFRFSDRREKVGREFTIGVAGRARGKAGVAFWIEISGRTANGKTAILRFLFEPGEAKGSRLKRIVVKPGKHTAVEWPITVASGPSKGGVSESYERLGFERVKVGAGEFRTERGRHVSPDGAVRQIWSSSEAPLFGLVKAISRKHEIELIAMGRDYEPLITEIPVMLEDHTHSGDAK